MPNRQQRAKVAAQTVAIVEAGTYVSPSGSGVSIRDAVREAVQKTAVLRSGEAVALRAGVFDTTFEVRNDSTFAVARRLVGRFGAERVAALNFASAKNPGGGFLSGAQAQEECLARASALHACLAPQHDFYDANRACGSPLYTDHLIASPGVPVFRDDADRLLEAPWAVTILTCPAPNAGAVAANWPDLLREVAPTFRRRIGLVLGEAAARRQAALVLGAWGCGVFGNDPATVAGLFAEQLEGGGPFAGVFEHVSFAVLDPHGETVAAFEVAFGELAR